MIIRSSLKILTGVLSMIEDTTSTVTLGIGCMSTKSTQRTGGRLHLLAFEFCKDDQEKQKMIVPVYRKKHLNPSINSLTF